MIQWFRDLLARAVLWRPRSRGGTRILRAVIAAIRPHGHGFDQPIDEDVLLQVQGSLRNLPLPLRFGVSLGLWFIEYGPPLYARRWRRFSGMPAAEGERHLADWHRLGGPRGALVHALRSFIFLAFYQHPDVLAFLEIDWAGRASSLIRLRAELLRVESAGAPDGH